MRTEAEQISLPLLAYEASPGLRIFKNAPKGILTSWAQRLPVSLLRDSLSGEL